MTMTFFIKQGYVSEEKEKYHASRVGVALLNDEVI